MARSGSKIVVVVGICLVALGAGNAITGNSKMNEYRQRKRAAVAAGGETVKLPFSGTPSILDPTTDAQLLYESAAIKYEYYRIVRRGGYYFLAFGVALLVGSAVRSRMKRRPGRGDGSASFQVTATP